MTYVPGNPLSGDSLGRPEAWIGWAEAQGAHRLDDVRAYVRTVYDIAPRVGVGAHKIVVQSIHETTEDGVPWASLAWTACCNPAGIGVTDDSKRTWHAFRDGRTAALAHLVHVSLYVLGEIPDELEEYRDLDPRWRNVTRSILGRKRTLQSFGGSIPQEPTWAVDPLYGTKWADRLNDLAPIFAETPAHPAKGKPAMALNMDKGLIPLPRHEKKIIGRKDTGVSWVGKRTVRGETIHRMQGSFVSAYNHFSNPNVAALTDWGLDAMTGTLWLFNDPFGDRTPWASGKLNGEGYGDGRAFYLKYGLATGIGAEVINRDRESCEVSGFFRQPGTSVTADSPWSEVSMRVLAQLHASRAHDYGIKWGDYPIARPKDDFSFVAHHQEFTLQAFSLESTLKICPGAVVVNATPELIEMTRDIMKSYQETGIITPEKPVEPEPGLVLYPPGMDAGIAAMAYGRVVADDGEVHAWNPKYAACRLWLDLGWAGGTESRFPELVEVRTFDNRKYHRYSDGLLIWMPSKNEAVRVLGMEQPDSRAA